MNNTKTFNLLYYISLVLTLTITIIVFLINSGTGLFMYAENTPVAFLDFVTTSFSQIILVIINIVLAIIYTVSLKKRQLKNINIIFPIMYLIFTIIVSIVATLFNSKLIIPVIHYNYYFKFILLNYLSLNIYSLLSISKKVINEN